MTIALPEDHKLASSAHGVNLPWAFSDHIHTVGSSIALHLLFDE